MIDPEVITIGGGLSNAYNCFKEKMFDNIRENCPSFNFNNIIINASKYKELSTMLGACLMVKTKLNNL